MTEGQKKLISKRVSAFKNYESKITLELVFEAWLGEKYLHEEKFFN